MLSCLLSNCRYWVCGCPYTQAMHKRVVDVVNSSRAAECRWQQVPSCELAAPTLSNPILWCQFANRCCCKESICFHRYSLSSNQTLSKFKLPNPSIYLLCTWCSLAYAKILSRHHCASVAERWQRLMSWSHVGPAGYRGNRCLWSGESS